MKIKHLRDCIPIEEIREQLYYFLTQSGFILEENCKLRRLYTKDSYSILMSKPKIGDFHLILVFNMNQLIATITYIKSGGKLAVEQIKTDINFLTDEHSKDIIKWGKGNNRKSLINRKFLGRKISKS